MTTWNNISPDSASWEDIAPGGSVEFAAISPCDPVTWDSISPGGSATWADTAYAVKYVKDQNEDIVTDQNGEPMTTQEGMELTDWTNI